MAEDRVWPETSSSTLALSGQGLTTHSRPISRVTDQRTHLGARESNLYRSCNSGATLACCMKARALQPRTTGSSRSSPIREVRKESLYEELTPHRARLPAACCAALGSLVAARNTARTRAGSVRRRYDRQPIDHTRGDAQLVGGTSGSHGARARAPLPSWPSDVALALLDQRAQPGRRGGTGRRGGLADRRSAPTTRPGGFAFARAQRGRRRRAQRAPAYLETRCSWVSRILNSRTVARLPGRSKQSATRARARAGLVCRRR